MTGTNSSGHALVTAAILVIGDEILSGRTKDKNIGYIAEYLTALGIDLKEVRVVGDEEDAIVDALNALRHRYTYVFTTGGIGPTHDDITADCIAKAFGVSIAVDPRALADRACGRARGRHRHPARRDCQGQSRGGHRQLSLLRPAAWPQHQRRPARTRWAEACQCRARRRGHAGARARRPVERRLRRAP